MTEILNAQLADPFRIVLLIGLFITMLRTRAATGTYVPLALGAVAVSLIIASTMPSDGPFVQRLGLGVVANVILLGLIHGIYSVYLRATGK